jgi:hypothetical protein
VAAAFIIIASIATSMAITANGVYQATLATLTSDRSMFDSEVADVKKNCPPRCWGDLSAAPCPF